MVITIIMSVLLRILLTLLVVEVMTLKAEKEMLEEEEKQQAAAKVKEINERRIRTLKETITIQEETIQILQYRIKYLENKENNR